MTAAQPVISGYGEGGLRRPPFVVPRRQWVRLYCSQVRQGRFFPAMLLLQL